MTAIKNAAIFIILSLSLSVFASDTYVRIGETESCEEYQLSPEGQYCIDYLNASPQASWTGAQISGGLFVGFLLLAIVPPATVCTLFGASSAACLATAIPCDIVGGIGAIVSGGCAIGWTCKSSSKAKKKEPPFIIARLISDSYNLLSNKNYDDSLLQEYLTNYQDRFALNKDNTVTLAQRIILANEAGSFVPQAGLIPRGEFEPYRNCSDVPNISTYLNNISLGKFAGQQPQAIVDALLVTEIDSLKEQRDLFRQAIKPYNEAIQKYVSQAHEAQKSRLITDQSLLVNY